MSPRNEERDLTSQCLCCIVLTVNRATYINRRLHLVDIENLLACPRPTLSDVIACREQYNACAPVLRGDLVVVGCNHGAYLPVRYGWAKARLLLCSGEHGAESVLLDVIPGENVQRRFGKVVVGSGDGMFTDAVGQLGRLGVEVTVVANRRALSRHLRLAAKHIVLFDAEPLPTRPAAALREVA